MHDMIRLADVCERLGISKNTICRWLRRGLGPRYVRTPTGMYLFSPHDVDEWFASWERGEPRPAGPTKTR